MKDRSLSVSLSDEDHDGFIVHSFAGDDDIDCRDYVRERVGLPPFKPNGRDKPIRTISYEYRDPASGDFCYGKTRLDYTDGHKDIYFDTPKGYFKTNKHLLYGGERLADLSEGQPVWIVEGEKKVDRLRALGAIAVSGDTGHGSKWTQDHADLLRGLPVILWPDSDGPGERYIANAAAAILAVGPVADIRVVRPFGPPDGAKGRDVCDWTGNAERLTELAAGALPYTPPLIGNGGDADYVPPGEPNKSLPFTRKVKRGGDFLAEYTPIIYAIDGVLPSASIYGLTGKQGGGKTSLLQAIALSGITGKKLIGFDVEQGRAAALSRRRRACRH